MTTLFIAPIRKEVVVNASQEKAFTIFTEKMDLWWPRTHHIGKTPMTELVLEPVIGGRWYSRHEDGSEVNVGKVLEWEAHERILLAWQINGNFQFDPGLITQVEVFFIPEAQASTRVKFEHRNLERMEGGKAIESMDQGWGMIFQLYKNLADQV